MPIAQGFFQPLDAFGKPVAAVATLLDPGRPVLLLDVPSRKIRALKRVTLRVELTHHANVTRVGTVEEVAESEKEVGVVELGLEAHKHLIFIEAPVSSEHRVEGPYAEDTTYIPAIELFGRERRIPAAFAPLPELLDEPLPLVVRA